MKSKEQSTGTDPGPNKRILVFYEEMNIIKRTQHIHVLS